MPTIELKPITKAIDRDSLLKIISCFGYVTHFEVGYKSQKAIIKYLTQQEADRASLFLDGAVIKEQIVQVVKPESSAPNDEINDIADIEIEETQIHDEEAETPEETYNNVIENIVGYVNGMSSEQILDMLASLKGMLLRNPSDTKIYLMKHPSVTLAALHGAFLVSSQQSQMVPLSGKLLKKANSIKAIFEKQLIEQVMRINDQYAEDNG